MVSLVGQFLPSLILPCTAPQSVDLSQLTGLSVIFIYPWTGKPGHPNPQNWDDIPGAHGSTPQSIAYSNHYDAFCNLNVKCFGLSQLDLEWQKDFVRRNSLKVPLLSDEAGHFAAALGLQYIETGGKFYLKRRTLITHEQKIIFDRIDFSPPEEDADFILAFLKTSSPLNRPLGSLPLVGRAGVGVVPAYEARKEFLSNCDGLSDPHPDPPHKWQGISEKPHPDAKTFLTGQKTSRLAEGNPK